MQRDAAISESLYPNALSVGNNALPLQYAFDPAAADDGVSIDVPISLLNQVSSEKLDWLVPGLLPEKCLALIKSLPKALRKNFVPAPEFAEKALAGLDASKGSLRAALADRLFRMTGVAIAESDFQVAGLDKHLSIQVRVVDASGKVLGSGRNLAALFQQFKARAPDRQPTHALARVGLKTWDFETLPASVTTKEVALVLAF